MKCNLKAWVSRWGGEIQHLWLIGTLFRAGRKTYARALYEFTYLFVWSVLPFFLGAITLYVISDQSDKNHFELALSTFRNGELLVFTISMLAPILYLVLHDPQQAEPFPHKLPVSTTVTLIAVTCAALFALIKANAVKDVDFVFQFSVALTLVALIFRYLALVYHHVRLPDVSELELRAPQEGFVKQYRKHLGEPEPQPVAQQATDFTDAFGNHLGGQQ
ncbi:hypothetical protein MTYP_01925 [Methylophilaceae bacterium]|nr:hypothetical protein MTYP_01925 [Methylophilaceae bacterium]